MTFQEMIDDFLGLVHEIPDDPEDAVLITGFLNEQMSDFSLPLTEMLAVVKHRKPAIAAYLELIGTRDFKKLMQTGLSLEQALERLGAAKDYFSQADS